MLQLFYLDVTKVDLNVAYIYKCFKCLYTYVCKCFYLDVEMFCNGHTCFQVFSGVLDVCCGHINVDPQREVDLWQQVNPWGW
jgi:hypothetical protein